MLSLWKCGFVNWELWNFAATRRVFAQGMRNQIIQEIFRITPGFAANQPAQLPQNSAHDMRDWHQRQVVCPPHPSHGAGFWKDAFWQLTCEFRLVSPPRFVIEPEVAQSPFYRFVERFWMAQQVPLALLLLYFGGMAWVLWGINRAG